MKKKFMAVFALVLAVALTSYSVSGTYAKYASEVTRSDEARVAKWFTDTALSIDMFKESYIASDGTSETSVKSKSGKVVAPGTIGKYEFKIDGSNVETNYTLKVESLEFTQTTQEMPASYQPIKFYLFKGTVSDEELKSAQWSTKKSSAVDTTQSGVDATGLKSALDTEFQDKVFEAQKSTDTYTIVWEWELGSADTVADDTNTKDTKLGKSAAGGDENEKFKFEVKVNAVQSDKKATETA